MASPVVIAALIVVGLVVVAVAVIVFLVVQELSKPLPTKGTPKTLPNGMKIKHWQDAETNFLYKEIFGDHEAYSLGGITFAPGQTIIDAGANIGMFALFAAQQCRGDARIFCFEPMPATFGVLEQNTVSANAGEYSAQFRPAAGARLAIRPFKLGLSNEAATVEFEHHPAFTIWSTTDPGFAQERRRRIIDDLQRLARTSPALLVRLAPASLVRLLATAFMDRYTKTEKVPAKLVTLAEFAASEPELKGKAPIDLLKVDVEGAEIRVLEGLDDALWARIQQVVLEVENFAAVRQVRGILEARGFRVIDEASERKANPGVLSEVSMVYAVRPGYKGPAAARA